MGVYVVKYLHDYSSGLNRKALNT